VLSAFNKVFNAGLSQPETGGKAMNINKETTIRISGWLLIGLLNAVVLSACSSRSKPPPAPKTQTAKSAKTGAIWGGLAGLVFGGNLSDAVEGAVIGGAGGAVYGSVKGSQQLKAEKNDLARQQLRIEQERNYILQDEIAASKASQGTYAPQANEELLTRAFGSDNVRSLKALRDCDHRRAQLYAMAGGNSDFLSHRLASVYLEAMIAEDLGNSNTAAAAYQQIVVQDASIANADRARMETLDALTDVRAERRTMGIVCGK
jgi:hypothetical protein